MENSNALQRLTRLILERFKINSKKINEIAKCFDVKPESVELMNAKYQEISSGIKYQYLAHVIRTVETEIRKKPNFGLFQIQCVPVENGAMPCGFGSAQYYEENLYIIYYDPGMDEKQLRIVIAHELGHLVVETMIKNENPNAGISEPLSSIFGVLTILDKNDFYHSRTKPYQHASAEEIIRDFLLLKNRSNEKFNISK